MSKSPSEQIALTVRAADNMTEVFLADSRFELIANGIGRTEATVAPGLYKARFRVGQVQTDSLIEVETGGASKIFDGTAVQFASPVPMPQTLTYRQAQAEAAQQLSRVINLKQGTGSQLFLFLRGLTAEASRPWVGVSLHDLSGKQFAEAGQGTCDTANCFCGLNIELDPGTYRLRVEEEPGEIYEMFIVTLAGWQTQVFALAETSWQPGVQAVRAALPDAAVLMAEIDKGFDPANPAVRQTELLRLGLMHGRKILTEIGLKNLLAGTLNPMNAVFIAHLLARREDEVLQALAVDLVGHIDSSLAAHPDLRAALLVPQFVTSNETPPIFTAPPMLNSSWQLITQAVDKEKAVIPSGSLNEQIKAGVLNTALWLLHRLP
ncbi:MAG: hypothetical protein CDV28_11615 [Candidatus Electronema aureum]|uniref:Uncharacterized protein n=1 Tax=Candidatus Electronema aureum TaxID=2005002 RepID=A0A521G1D7_9BACT|nr:MAG: hypothetical protein CDV28_11615 [Candidatus Electronema aureum]